MSLCMDDSRAEELIWPFLAVLACYGKFIEFREVEELGDLLALVDV